MNQIVNQTPRPTTGDRQRNSDQAGAGLTRKAAGRWIGVLMLAAFGLYGGGALLAEDITTADVITSEVLLSTTQLRVGVLLIVANSVAVIAIGALMFRLAATTSSVIRLAYLGARLFEGIFLAIGAIFLVLLIPAAEAGDNDLARVLTEGNNVAYQMAMIGLCAGSVPLFWALAKTRSMPRWLGLWGVAGYAIFGTGAALELYDVAVGTVLTVPGGIFEVTFAIYLIWKGLPETTEAVDPSHMPDFPSPATFRNER
ncbi:MAG: DUF4386 domain-containing protein [Acidimicrobiales bacterium]